MEYESKKLGIRGIPVGMPSIIVKQALIDKFAELGIETGQIAVTVNHTPDSKEIGTTGFAFIVVAASDAQKAIDALDKTELFEGHPIDIAIASPYAESLDDQYGKEDDFNNPENEGSSGEGDLR